MVLLGTRIIFMSPPLSSFHSFFFISFIKDPHVSRMSKHVNVQLPTRRSSTSLHVLPSPSHNPPMFPHEPQPQYLHPSHRHDPAPPSHLHQQTLRPSHGQKGNHLTPPVLSAFMLRTQMLFSLVCKRLPSVLLSVILRFNTFVVKLVKGPKTLLRLSLMIHLARCIQFVYLTIF